MTIKILKEIQKKDMMISHVSKSKWHVEQYSFFFFLNFF